MYKLFIALLALVILTLALQAQEPLSTQVYQFDSTSSHVIPSDYFIKTTQRNLRDTIEVEWAMYVDSTDNVRVMRNFTIERIFDLQYDAYYNVSYSNNWRYYLIHPLNRKEIEIISLTQKQQ